MVMSQNPRHKHTPDKAENSYPCIYSFFFFLMDQLKKSGFERIRWNCNSLPDFGNSTTDFQAFVTSSRESLNLDIVQSEEKNKGKKWGSLCVPLLLRLGHSRCTSLCSQKQVGEIVTFISGSFWMPALRFAGTIIWRKLCLPQDP